MGKKMEKKGNEGGRIKNLNVRKYVFFYLVQQTLPAEHDWSLFFFLVARTQKF